MASANKGRSANSGNRRPSGNRKSPSSGRKNNSRRDVKNLVSVDDSIKDEVILLVILACCILLYLALFNILGSFGKILGGLMFGLFGIVSFVVPIVLFLSAAFYLSNKGRGVAYVKVTAGIVLSLVLGAFAQMIFDKDYNAVKITDYYLNSSVNRCGGGIIGGGFSHILIRIIGKPGTCVLLIILGIICIVLITEKSFFGGVKKHSKAVYDSARDSSDRYKIAREERRREREEYLRQHPETEETTEKKSRRDNVVKGVMLNTALTPELSSNENGEMHEISFESSDEEIEEIENLAVKTNHSIDFNDDYIDEFVNEKPKVEGPVIKNAADDIREITPKKTSTKPSAVKVDKEPLEALSPDVTVSTLNNPAKRATSGDVSEIKSDEPSDKKAETKKVVPVKSSSQNPSGEYHFPPIELLKSGSKNNNMESKDQLMETASRLQSVLKTFGVNVTITDIAQGPTVTRYEMLPEVGTKVSKITGLADDIKLNMAAADVRIEAPIPGKAAVGIEIPNKENATVMFRDLIEHKNFKDAQSKISFAVGKDLSGDTIVADIGKMPHMLIAGSTGSGKSVCINTLIMSIIYKATPDEVKLIMVDPKVVELSVYNGIPHLMIPVVTDPKKAAAALNWGVSEMTDRYNKFAELGVRDLKGYNKKISEMPVESEDERPKKLPQIVIIVDELADLMMVASKEVEEAICRLAQLARAAGIHLIIATQRPSVDVITGLIKANMPSRVAFAVSSGTDSRTILDMNGAEKLLGKGDMLFYPQGYPKPTRLQGAFISDDEIAGIVDFLKEQAGGDSYDPEVKSKIEAQASSGSQGGSGGGFSDSSADDKDDLFIQAAQLVIEQDKASIGFFQRKFKIGFNRAARIMDQLAEAGVVGEEEGTKPRKVIMSMEQFENALEQGEI